MINFSYYNPARIYFGKESEKDLDKILASYNIKTLLMVYSGDFIKELGIYDTVKNACSSEGIRLLECGKVVPNPRVELVRELIDLGKEESVDMVLAIGGGSSIDTAKAVAMGIEYKGDIWDFFKGEATPKKALPIGVISTLPASGSETSNATIITNGEYKLGVEADCIIPSFTIMNPDFTLGLPAYQTACGIVDMYSHLLERYFTETQHVDLTDYLIEGAIKALLVNAERVRNNPKDFNARAELMWIASVAHNNLLDTGRQSDWGSHRVEHEISAEYDLTHGEGMGIVLIAYCKFASKRKPKKLAQLANRVYGIDSYNYSEEEMACILGDKIQGLVEDLGLKTSLRQVGIDEEKFELMAKRATKNGSVGHYIELGSQEIIEILNIAL